jgi:hypothetical protein
MARNQTGMRGLRPSFVQTEVEHHDEVVEVVERYLLDRGLAQPGEDIVILMGDPIREKPLTNLMRMLQSRARAARLNGQLGGGDTWDGKSGVSWLRYWLWSEPVFRAPSRAARIRDAT